MNFVETDKKIVSPRGPTLTIHLGGVYHGKPFCHQMGPYQTLLAETWRTLLQITFRVFFMSGNHGNHKNRSRKSRDVLFLKKKAPARQPRVVVGMGFYRNPSKSKIFPINMEKYPTQNDATDHIYPLGPPKPILLCKNN